ncbi:hypothetical protein INT44_001253 [Umbelopsis vinacea]|uniref:Polyadenylate tail-binding protein n=1 Tax=Umbelopsis vinacea TaxID=44442 RepID=A0A8H7URQ8_9FUNG|nr:hypothetical protein INT44_001253 [Umbelopsis vinacea]
MQAPDPINEDLNSGSALKDSISASSVYPYAPMDRQMSHPIVGQDTFSEVPTINIDFTNLYIKNLDLNIKSSDLFNLFRKFGRIISARVMNNAQTGISKGFGFVSFSKAEEAFMALQEMNGKLVLSKHVIVAYHEPKKPRSERPALVHPPTTNMIGVPPTLPHKLNPYPSAMPSPNVYDPTMPYSNNDMSRAYMQSYIPPPPPPGVIPPAPIVFRPEDQIPMQFPSQPGHMMMGYHPANGSYPPSYPYNDDYVTGSVNRIVKKYSNNALRQHQPSEGSSDTMSLQTIGAALPPSSAAPPPTGDGPSLSSLASGASVQLPPKIPLPKQKTLRRNSLESVSSVMTESSSNVQKVRMADAVRRAGETNNADDIVDMLLTLKRKERSLCLFNPDFLKEKIKLAKEALELFVDEASNNEKVYQPATSPLPTGLSRELSIERNGHNNDQFERYSNDQYRSGGGYNMHVHKPRSQQSSTSPKSTGNTSNEATRSEIDNFLASLQGYSLFEKKQKLGDRLFPLVKATGTKQAPKITIRLLDTIELNELAHLMHDKTKLKTKVDETFMVIQQ